MLGAQDQYCPEGFCREEVTFVINWARPDGAILNALKLWLKSPGRRPHKDFKAGSVTSAHEHLRKLGALRVLSKITAEKACDRDPKTGEEFCTLYKLPDEYRRAKLQASEVLKNLFPSADT